MQLDRQCRAVHVRNFRRLGNEDSWLFLNVDPYIAVQGLRFGSFAQMLEENGLPAHRVAVELIETPFDDEKRLVAAVEHYRTIGCLIAIDDFGAGYSNFDRIWRLKPDIVKIDREMTRRVTVEPLARRMFAGIISVLHESGALVCVEGIETEAEALCATDADADLVQGNYFASPTTQLQPEHACDDLFARLFRISDSRPPNSTTSGAFGSSLTSRPSRMRCSRYPPVRIARAPYGRSSTSIAPSAVTWSQATAPRSARAWKPKATSPRATGA